MKNTPKILGLVTIGLLMLAMVQGHWKLIPVTPLKGVSESQQIARPTLRELADGRWQASAEKWATANFGFRQPAIRLYNQYVWSCYHKSMNKTVIPGKDGYLYERYFVEDYYESRMYRYTDDPQVLRDKFSREARRLAMVQELLAEQGTTLFVAVLPGKDILYPEYLPPRDTMTREPLVRAYPEYLRQFDRYGVNYVDVLAWFKAIKGTVDYDLMTKGGTHWSNIASVYAFDSIMRYMQRIGGKAIRKVETGTPYFSRVREPDNDLAMLLNTVVTPAPSKEKYVDVRLEPATSASGKPGLIVIGDSFFWNVHYNFPLDSLFRYEHYWFYNNSIYFDPEHDNTSQVDLAEALRDADYVMLSYCSGQLYDLGNEFIGRALVALTHSDDEVQAVRDTIKARIMSDERWLRNLQNKSEREGMTLEQAILNDANYLIETRPEEYFDKLKILL